MHFKATDGPVDEDADEVTFDAAHGFTTDPRDRVLYKDGDAATGITGLVDGVIYYAKAGGNGQSLQLSATVDGDAIAIRDGAAGNHFTKFQVTTDASLDALDMRVEAKIGKANSD